MSEKKINLDAARQAFESAASEHSQEFELFFLSKFYGLHYFYTDKTCEITFEPKEFSFNPQGSLHGGVITTIMDISMGHLLKKTQGAGVTLEIKVQFMKALKVVNASVLVDFLGAEKVLRLWHQSYLMQMVNCAL